MNIHVARTPRTDFPHTCCQGQTGGLMVLSEAFGTLDHSSISELLSCWYCISDTALNWVHSTNRVQRVKLLDKLGKPFKRDYGVSQSSVLEPLLFTLYTTPLISSVISRHNICHHLYADDTQIILCLSRP